MKVSFKSVFIKDFRKLPPEVKKRVREICLKMFPLMGTTRDFKGNVKELRGFDDYYRIRLGDYRIGFKIENGSVVFMRVLHRRDIYRHFP